MKDRYQKQIILSEIGESGQQQLSKASVLVIGAGGLGLMVSSYLVAMGIGNVGICDFDFIEESNLHRQFYFTPAEIGKSKATILAEKLRLQNPSIMIKDFVEKIDKKTILSIAGDYSIICDCTDQGNSRIIINDYCQKNKKSLVHGAVSDWQGYVTVFHYLNGFNLRDLFDFSDYLKIQSCSDIGISSPVCGLIGSYMANETIKIILSFGNTLEGKILHFNTLTNQIRTINIKKQVATVT